MNQSIFLKAKYLKNECKEVEDLFFEHYISFFKEVQSVTGKDLSKLNNGDASLSKKILTLDHESSDESKVSEEREPNHDDKKGFLSERLKPIYKDILYGSHPDKYPAGLSERERKRLSSIYTDCVEAANSSDFFGLVDCAYRSFIEFPKFDKSEKELLEKSCSEFRDKIIKYKKTYPWIWGIEISGDTLQLKALGVGTAELAADAVTGAKLADNAVDSEHYVDGSIDTAHIADDQVTLAKMAGLARGTFIYGDASGDPANSGVGTLGYMVVSDGTDLGWGQVSTAGIADNQVTLAKLADFGARGSFMRGGVAGAPEELALGTTDYVLMSDGTDVAYGQIVDDSIANDAAIANSKLANSTISGVSLGGTLGALSDATDSGLSMSSYDGSAAVSDLKLDFLQVTGGLTADLGAPASNVRTGASILSDESVLIGDHPLADSPQLFRNGVLYQGTYMKSVAPTADGEWGLIDNGSDVDLKIWEQTASDFDGDDWMVICVPTSV
jgi:hypothetical protein